MGNCVSVARQTLTLFVGVRIPIPQPKIDRFRPVDFLSIAKAMVYHHAARVYLITEGVYHQPQAAFSFRNDDIQLLRN